MGIALSFRKGLIIFLVFLLTSLLLSCSPGDIKKADVVDKLSAAEQEKLAKYARKGDTLAAVALDMSIAHITVSHTNFFRDKRHYWFDSQTTNFVIDQLGSRGEHGTTLVTHKKNSLVLRDYSWGGGKAPGRTMIQTEISNATIKFLEENYSSLTKFADLFGEGADAFRKLPSYVYARSNREFLAYFYDPTYIGGVASDYSYGPKKSVTFAGREAYKVRIGPSESYKKRLIPGFTKDYIGNSYIEVYFDKRTGLPLKVDKTIDNGNLKYSTTAILDLKKVKKLPFVSAADDNKFNRRYHRRLIHPNELKTYDLPMLGTSYKGYECQPVILESTDTVNWNASLSYQKGTDGFVIDVAVPVRSRQAKDDFIGRIKGISEEKTLVERSHSDLAGADVHKDPIPDPKVEKVKVAGIGANLYSYVGLVALQIQVGTKTVFIHELDEFHDDFLLSRDMIFDIASELLKE